MNAVFLLLNVLVLLTILVLVRKRRAAVRVRLEALAAGLGGRVETRSFSGSVVVGVYQGLPFTCAYFGGSKNRPSSLTISIRSGFAAKMVLRRENRFDRFTKRIGLNSEIQTGDPQFDETFFVDTVDREFSRNYWSDIGKRETAESIFASPEVKEIHTRDQEVAVVLSPVRIEEIDPAEATRLLGQLLKLSEGLPPVSAGYGNAPEAFSASSNRAFRLGLVFVTLGALNLAGLVLLVLGLVFYRPLNWGFVFRSLYYALPLLAIFLFFAFQAVKGGSSSARIFLPLVLMAGIGFLVGGIGLVLFTNGYLDRGTIETRQVRVSQKYFTTSKNSRTYYLCFSSWKPPKSNECLSVPVALYSRLREGDAIRIQTKPGAWGQEWVYDVSGTASARTPDSGGGEQSLALEQIRFYEGGFHNLPEKMRRYGAIFPQSRTRYVWCQLRVRNLLEQVENQQHRVTWRYYNPDGTLRGEMRADFRISKTWAHAWVEHSWGWEEPGQWPVGTYRAELRVDGRPFGTGQFRIVTDTPSNERAGEDAN